MVNGNWNGGANGAELLLKIDKKCILYFNNGWNI